MVLLTRILPSSRKLSAFRRKSGIVIWTRLVSQTSSSRLRVEALLQAYEQAGDFLGRPAADRRAKAAQAFPAGEKPGDRIGHYKLLQQIGEGGCGVVYMAEQEEPVRRRVALKIIKREWTQRA